MQSREYVDYRRLVGHFSNRLFESDVIARGGSLHELIVTIAALLAAAGIAVGYFMAIAIARHPHMSESAVEALRWGSREFLLSLSMVFTAVLSIVSWDSVFPDRTDCVFLSQMPLRMRTVMAAKMSTLVAAFLITFISANAFTAILFPLGSAAPGRMAITVAAHIASALAASAFVFFTFLAMQALLIHVLPYRLVKRVSAWIQLGALFTVLFGFFLIPPISAPGVLTSPANHRLVSLIPSFWFVGLYQTMLGTADPVLHWLAWRALIALTLSVSLALAGYLAGYSRYVRKTIEESGAVVEIRKPRLSGAKRLLDRSLFANPRQRAVFWFGWRTMVRNRMPRLMLAAYASVGFVYVIDGLASALKKTAGNHEPNAEVGAFPLILPFFLLLGMRVLFTFPVELGANWLFRLVDEEGDPASALPAVRKLMMVVGIVPVCIVSLPMYGLLWGWGLAFWHLLLALLIALTLLEMLTTGFYKIPFTCSFMPGKANLKATFAIYAVGFFIIAFITVNLELWILMDTVRTVKGVVFFGALLAWASWRRRSEEEGPAARLVYEERGNWQLNTLELT
jgi:hypothetical protein